MFSFLRVRFKGSNASKTSVAVPLLIVFLLLICAGLGFAYYKFV